MNEQIRNVNPLEYLNSKIDINSKLYVKILIRIALFREKDSVHLCLAEVNFLYKSDIIPENSLDDYGSIVLAEYTLDLKEWPNFLKSLQSESMDILTVKNVKISGGFNQDCWHVSSRSRFSGVYNEWPFWYAMYSAKQDAHFSGTYDLIATPGKPAYSNFFDAVRSFFKLEDGFNMNTPVGIYLKVPDYRARIKTLEIAEKHVMISIETRESKIEDLIVQLYCKKGNHDFHPKSDLVLDSNGIVSTSLPFIPDYVDAILLEKKTGDKIDSKTFGSWHRNDGIVIRTSKENVETMLTSRENQYVEFKQNLDNKNQSEFLETVVSFANTNDGTILLGVDDEGNVVGIHDDFDKVQKRIKGLVNSLCEPTIDLSIEEMIIDDRTIIVIKVKDGLDKPYLVNGRNAFKRVGDDDIPFKRIDFDNIYQPKYSQQQNVRFGM